jgi:hypothetical protein
VEERTLTIAQFGKFALVPRFVWKEGKFGLADKFFKSAFNEAQNRGRVRVGLVRR